MMLSMIWLLGCGSNPTVPPSPAEADTDTDTDTDADTDADSDTADRTDTADLDPPPPTTDADNDGVAVPLDCDDNNPDVHPSATEIPTNGIDENCDQMELCYRDTDGDRFGTGLMLTDDLTCQINGTSTHDGDCDDTNADVHPAAVDVPDDGIDQDCDGADATD